MPITAPHLVHIPSRIQMRLGHSLCSCILEQSTLGRPIRLPHSVIVPPEPKDFTFQYRLLSKTSAKICQILVEKTKKIRALFHRKRYRYTHHSAPTMGCLDDAPSRLHPAATASISKMPVVGRRGNISLNITHKYRNIGSTVTLSVIDRSLHTR